VEIWETVKPAWRETSSNCGTAVAGGVFVWATRKTQERTRLRARTVAIRMDLK